MLTTILAVFWLSGSAAWSNGTSALKTVTDVVAIGQKCGKMVYITSFSRLNISLLFGYLNFFLWVSKSGGRSLDQLLTSNSFQNILD